MEQAEMLQRRTSRNTTPDHHSPTFSMLCSTNIGRKWYFSYHLWPKIMRIVAMKKFRHRVTETALVVAHRINYSQLKNIILLFQQHLHWPTTRHSTTWNNIASRTSLYPSLAFSPSVNRIMLSMTHDRRHIKIARSVRRPPTENQPSKK